MNLKIHRREPMLPTHTLQASQEPTVARPRKPTIELPPHVNVVRVKGRPYYYCHPGRGTKNAGKPIRLPDDVRSPEFWTAYRRLNNEPAPRADAKNFTSLIEAYRKSPEFQDLADSTKTGYEHYLEIIVVAWGHLNVEGLLPAHVLALRDKHRETPAAANGMLRVLSVLISWGVPRGFRSDNPCTHVRKLKIGEGWVAWPWEMIELVREVGPAWMWRATALALFTGQRQGDVLQMTWGAVKGGLVEVRQEKTGRRLVIPAHQGLLAVLAEVPRNSTRVLTNTRGLPWTKSGFKASWQKALKGPLATIRERGLVFHGLRKSAVVTLLEAGATEAEVAAITGQTLHMVAHYARQVNQRKLAASAILKWERAGNGNLQNRLQNPERESD
jgi:Phage integrase family